MTRKRSQREVAAIAAKKLASGVDPMKRAFEDEKFLRNLNKASDTSLTKSQRRSALNAAESLGTDQRIGVIIAKRSLELQLRGIPKNRADSIAADEIGRKSGLLRTPAKPSPI